MVRAAAQAAAAQAVAAVQAAVAHVAALAASLATLRPHSTGAPRTMTARLAARRQVAKAAATA